MIIGVDYASVDGNKPPKLDEFKRSCTRATSRAAIVIIRGAWGTVPDPTLPRDWNQVIAAGLIPGAYLFLRMPHPGFDAPPEKQVQVFAENVGALTARHMVPSLDIEDTGLPPAAELDWVNRAWLEMRRIYGVAPMIYTSERVWREDLKNLPAGEMVDSPLWLAKPWPWRIHTPPRLDGSAFSTNVYDPRVPVAWGAGNWWLHQYQGDAFQVEGFTQTVDLSRFNVMRQGERGERVKWVQRRLGMAQTSVFDNFMYQRVRQFQQSSLLDVDGIIGPQTFTAITWCSGAERVR